MGSSGDDSYLGEIRQILLDGLAQYRVKVYLFGSRAEDRAVPGSDWDVAVDCLEPLPLGLLSTLRYRLEESRIPYEVDLVDLSDVAADFAGRVRREGKLWLDLTKG